MDDKTLAKQAIVSRSGGVLAVTLATNYGWRPVVLDPGAGVEPEAAQLPQGERVIVLRTLAELAKHDKPLTLHAWIERERRTRERRYGKGQGYWRLTADLAGVQYSPAMKQEKWAKALKRALERSGAPSKGSRKESHKTGKIAQKYQDVIAQLPGAERGNPFASPAARARNVLDRSSVELGITGDWSISRRVYTFAHKGTGLIPPNDTQREGIDYALRAPYPFIATALAVMSQGYGVPADLDRVYGLHIVVQLP